MLKKQIAFISTKPNGVSVNYDIASNPGGLSNILGQLNQNELGIMTAKIFEGMRHNSIGLWNSATPSNPKDIVNAGTAVFYIQKRLVQEEYTSGTRTGTKQTPKHEIHKKVNWTISPRYQWELETLDLKQMQFDTREAFIAHLTNSMLTNIIANTDAWYLAIATKYANDEAKAGRYDNVVFIPDLSDLDTQVKREYAYRKFARTQVEIARQINDKDLGTDEADYATIIHRSVMIDLKLAQPKGGESATKIGTDLMKEINFDKVAGLGVVKDHIFLDKTLDAGKDAEKIHTKYSFDFTKVFGMMSHNASLFIAFAGAPEITNAIHQDNGNLLFNYKTRMYKDVIRPELFKIFVEGDPTTPSANFGIGWKEGAL